MTAKEKIEEAAKECAIQAYDDAGNPLFTKDEIFWQYVAFKRGAEWVLQQNPYTKDDMMAFAE